MRVRLESIGCRLNISEIEEMARDFTAAGHTVVGPGEEADLCVFNSCTVTGIAARKSRQALRQLREEFPDATLVTTGCYSELAPEETRRLGVDLVVGNEHKDRLFSVLQRQGELGEDLGGSSAGSRPQKHSAAKIRTRAFLKVQDGCDNGCTFCVVTVARGPGRSRRSIDVSSEVRRLHHDGYKEIVLSGVHLGSWGSDLQPRQRLDDLVRHILDESEVPRIRLSSLEPWDLDERFFELYSDSRMLPHIHLPLQSGCDATLRRMARRTDQSRFGHLVDAARAAIPQVSISTDVMVGFPGETDEEFSESITFVESMGFSRLHVFRFSPRQGTPAATMPDKVPGAVARERSQAMHRLGSRLEHAFNSSFVGASQDVLWEESEEVGNIRRWSGLTGNYIRVTTETSPEVDLTSTITETRIVAPAAGGVLGEVEDVSTSGMTETIRRPELPIWG